MILLKFESFSDIGVKISNTLCSCMTLHLLLSEIKLFSSYSRRHKFENFCFKPLQVEVSASDVLYVLFRWKNTMYVKYKGTL